MKLRQPPRLATFVMKRLATCDRSLLGDLQEEYRAGRSRWWYWRETLHVFGWSLIIAVRTHPILLLRAVIALVIAIGVANIILSALVSYSLGFVMHAMPGWIYGRYQVHTLVWIALSFPVWTIAVWTIARLHGSVRVSATLVVLTWAMLSILGGDAELPRLWEHSSEPRYVPYLLRHVIGIMAWLAALVLGGMVLPGSFRGSVRCAPTTSA